MLKHFDSFLFANPKSCTNLPEVLPAKNIPGHGEKSSTIKINQRATACSQGGRNISGR